MKTDYSKDISLSDDMTIQLQQKIIHLQSELKKYQNRVRLYRKDYFSLGMDALKNKTKELTNYNLELEQKVTSLEAELNDKFEENRMLIKKVEQLEILLEEKEMQIEDDALQKGDPAEKKQYDDSVSKDYLQVIKDIVLRYSEMLCIMEAKQEDLEEQKNSIYDKFNEYDNRMKSLEKLSKTRGSGNLYNEIKTSTSDHTE
ncbi:hypothetical protein [Aquibacillus rhizosphaerae]|uniref:Uncharacterized protein n=1 Tax=Aquibacillus rhizosphaerae TaxID=3051431 RepID=A0ABT7LBG1_9BACI|nr:hypothetical protein [Aquibacillus sp. LR5S19]MDL4843212.1 hypothetical protein [Aquibacillus sp. LR5S19]